MKHLLQSSIYSTENIVYTCCAGKNQQQGRFFVSSPDIQIKKANDVINCPTIYELFLRCDHWGDWTRVPVEGTTGFFHSLCSNVKLEGFHWFNQRLSQQNIEQLNRISLNLDSLFVTKVKQKFRTIVTINYRNTSVSFKCRLQNVLLIKMRHTKELFTLWLFSFIHSLFEWLTNKTKVKSWTIKKLNYGLSRLIYETSMSSADKLWVFFDVEFADDLCKWFRL